LSYVFAEGTEARIHDSEHVVKALIDGVSADVDGIESALGSAVNGIELSVEPAFHRIQAGAECSQFRRDEVL